MDFKLEVVYPIDYISKAIPHQSVDREYILALARYILNGYWLKIIKATLCDHPRRIACLLFDEALIKQEELF